MTLNAWAGIEVVADKPRLKTTREMSFTILDIGNSFFIRKTNVTWAAFVPENTRLLKFGVDTTELGPVRQQIEEGFRFLLSEKNPPSFEGEFELCYG